MKFRNFNLIFKIFAKMIMNMIQNEKQIVMQSEVNVKLRDDKCMFLNPPYWPTYNMQLVKTKPNCYVLQLSRLVDNTEYFNQSSITADGHVAGLSPQLFELKANGHEAALEVWCHQNCDLTAWINVLSEAMSQSKLYIEGNGNVDGNNNGGGSNSLNQEWLDAEIQSNELNALASSDSTIEQLNLPSYHTLSGNCEVEHEKQPDASNIPHSTANLVIDPNDFSIYHGRVNLLICILYVLAALLLFWVWLIKMLITTCFGAAVVAPLKLLFGLDSYTEN